MFLVGDSLPEKIIASVGENEDYVSENRLDLEINSRVKKGAFGPSPLAGEIKKFIDKQRENIEKNLEISNRELDRVPDEILEKVKSAHGEHIPDEKLKKISKNFNNTVRKAEQEQVKIFNEKFEDLKIGNIALEIVSGDIVKKVKGKVSNNRQ